MSYVITVTQRNLAPAVGRLTEYQLSVDNKWRWWLWTAADTGELTGKVRWLGDGLHSSNEGDKPRTHERGLAI